MCLPLLPTTDAPEGPATATRTQAHQCDSHAAALVWSHWRCLLCTPPDGPAVTTCTADVRNDATCHVPSNPPCPSPGPPARMHFWHAPTVIGQRMPTQHPSTCTCGHVTRRARCMHCRVHIRACTARTTGAPARAIGAACTYMPIGPPWCIDSAAACTWSRLNRVWHGTCTFSVHPMLVHHPTGWLAMKDPPPVGPQRSSPSPPLPVNSPC